jgi:hypothetical protein
MTLRQEQRESRTIIVGVFVFNVFLLSAYPSKNPK